MNDEYSISTSNRFAIWFDTEDDPGDEPFSPPVESKKETVKDTKQDKNVRTRTKDSQRFVKPDLKQSDEGMKRGKCILGDGSGMTIGRVSVVRRSCPDYTGTEQTRTPCKITSIFGI